MEGRVLLVSNLTPEIRVADIFQTYSKAGQVDRICLGQGEALVYFADEDDAESSLVYNTIGDVDVDGDLTQLRTLKEIIEDVDYIVLKRIEAAKQQIQIAKEVDTDDEIEFLGSKSDYQRKSIEFLGELDFPVPVPDQFEEQIIPVVPFAVSATKDQSNMAETITAETQNNKETDYEETNLNRQTHEINKAQPSVIVTPERIIEKVEEVIEILPEKDTEHSPPPTAIFNFSNQQQEVSSSSHCPLSTNTQTSSCNTTFPTSEIQISSSSTPFNSVQLLKILKNASIPKRVALDKNDVFNQVKQRNFLLGLTTFLVLFTIFSHIL